MITQTQRDVTRLLHRWREGEVEALDRLMPLIYEELRRLAHLHLRNERSGHTLNTTALVHEVYLNLVGGVQVPWENRAHFFAVAARAMRRILISYARKRNRLKRGGGRPDLPLDRALVFTQDRFDELIALDQALTALEATDERLCRVVECRYFGGLTIEETAGAMGTSAATVKRDWNMAKAWLRRALYGGSPP